MMKIGQFSKNSLIPESVQQGPRSNTALTLARHRCATLPALGAITPHPAQPAVTTKSFTLSIVPQKIKSEKTHKDAKEIRQDTKAVFEALSNCEANASKNFSNKRVKSTNEARRKAESNHLKAYKVWRDSPADTPKEKMETIEADGRKLFKYLGRSFRAKGTMKLIEVLKHNVALESKIEPYSDGFRDVKTGLYCELHQVSLDPKKAEYVLCFPGTGAGAMDRMQWLNNIDQAIGTGEVPPAYKQAAELVDLIKTNLNKSNAKLTVAGHSLGGGIANYVGLKHDIPSVCYNAAPLGGACLRDLGTIPQDKLNMQLHIRCKGDLVSSPKVQQKLQSFLQIWNKKEIFTPRNAGTICNVGRDFEPEKSGFDRHRLTIFDSWYALSNKPPEININLLQMA